MRTDGSFVTTSLLLTTAGPDGCVLPFDGAVGDRQYAEMIAESIPHIVWTASPDGATTYFNRQGTDYTGWPRETNYEWNWVTLVHPEDVERAAQAWQHATMTGTDYLMEYRIRRFDGVFRWHTFRAIPLRDTIDGDAASLGEPSGGIDGRAVDGDGAHRDVHATP